MPIAAVFCSVAFRVALDRLSVQAEQNFRNRWRGSCVCVVCNLRNNAVKAAHFAAGVRIARWRHRCRSCVGPHARARRCVCALRMRMRAGNHCTARNAELPAPDTEPATRPRHKKIARR
jgi:hypothetical protein